MKALVDFDNDLDDKIFHCAYDLRVAGCTYYEFQKDLKSKYGVSFEIAREYWNRVNDFITATLNLPTEVIRSELILKAQAIQKDAKEDKAHGARVSALKLEIDLRIAESNEVETIRHEHILTLAPPPEPENELNEELEDEKETE